MIEKDLDSFKTNTADGSQEVNESNFLQRLRTKLSNIMIGIRQDRLEAQVIFKKGANVREAIAYVVATTGYLFSEWGIQGLDPNKYDQILEKTTNLLHQFGVDSIDQNLPRWQFSDFFASIYYSIWFDALITKRVVANTFKDREYLFGKNQKWYEEHSTEITAFSTLILLSVYEVIQANGVPTNFDAMDLIAYILGVGSFLLSEKVFKEYLVLKQIFKGKIQKYLASRKINVENELSEMIDAFRTELENFQSQSMIDDSSLAIDSGLPKQN